VILTKFKKAEKLIEDDKVFLLHDSDFYEHYLVGGSAVGTTYNVIFNKLKDIYSCDCGNVKLVNCYHIEGVKKYKGEMNGKS
jgi:hypothetical protein